MKKPNELAKINKAIIFCMNKAIIFFFISFDEEITDYSTLTTSSIYASHMLVLKHINNTQHNREVQVLLERARSKEF